MQISRIFSKINKITMTTVWRRWRINLIRFRLVLFNISINISMKLVQLLTSYQNRRKRRRNCLIRNLLIVCVIYWISFIEMIMLPPASSATAWTNLLESRITISCWWITKLAKISLTHRIEIPVNRSQVQLRKRAEIKNRKNLNKLIQKANLIRAKEPIA